MNITGRLNNLRSAFAGREIDGLFVTQADNRYYLSGFNGSAGYLFITGSKAVLATDFRYTEQAVSEAPEFEILRIANNISEWFPSLVRDGRVTRLGFDASDVSYQFYQALTGALESKCVDVELVPVSGIVETLRTVKEQEEIACVEKAVAISDAAFDAVAPMVKPGITENEIAWELEKQMRERGSQSLPFDIIVASGPKAALPHAKPTDRTVREGDAVVIDMGARYGGYASDLTRTLCAGTPDDQFRKVYGIVLDAQLSALRIIKNGVTGGEADAAARKVIEAAGYGEDFGHSLGHGVGLAEHEMPRLSPGVTDPLQDGMVFTVEPGIYLSGWGGVRIEDTVVIQNGKLRVLSQAGKATYD